MVIRKGAALAGMLVLALLVAPGCVSNKKFNSNVEDVDNRLTAAEGAIEDNESKIEDLRKSTDSKIAAVDGKAAQAQQTGTNALNRAQAAEEAAQGKLLWTVTITNDKVKFDFGKAELTTDAISALDQLVNKAKSYGKALYFEVEGHTDNVGAKKRNEVLGKLRAAAVRNYLNQNGGIPLHAMNTISYGESRPVADNSTKEGRAQNRRVVIRVLE